MRSIHRPRPPRPKDANWQRSADYDNEAPNCEPRPVEEAPDLESPQPYAPSRVARASPARSAIAMIVTCGFTPSEVGTVLPSAT